MSVDDIIRKIHIYTGLQATVALLIFSMSVIPSYVGGDKEPIHSRYKFAGNINATNIKLAETVHNQVGLRFEAMPEWWMISEQEPGHLLIKFKSPSARREVRLNKFNSEIDITTWPLTFFQFIDHMHQESIGRRRFSDSLWLWAWSLYIECSIFSLFILPITGLYIWVSGRSIKKHWAKFSLLLSFTTMLILWHSIR